MQLFFILALHLSIHVLLRFVQLSIWTLIMRYYTVGDGHHRTLKSKPMCSVPLETKLAFLQSIKDNGSHPDVEMLLARKRDVRRAGVDLNGFISHQDAV